MASSVATRKAVVISAIPLLLLGGIAVVALCSGLASSFSCQFLRLEEAESKPPNITELGCAKDCVSVAHPGSAPDCEAVHVSTTGCLAELLSAGLRS